MTPALPLLRPSEVVKAFERFGWQVARQRGSHIIMTKEGHIATPVICTPEELMEV
jgi:predicted RNA binding protein YcfA (HicA-like mRNA interferase family)